MNHQEVDFAQLLKRRHATAAAFEWCCRIATFSALLFLGILLLGVVRQAWGWLDWQYLTSFDSRFPMKAGTLAGIWGTFWLILFTAIFTVPIGVSAAIYLEEYARDGWFSRIVKVNLANLAGVPSIVYGMLGLTTFVRFFGWVSATDDLRIETQLGFGTLVIPLPLQNCILAGACTLSLLILPIVIIASQEALRAVPASIRHASYALGATKWQTIRHQVLPSATPGISTGVILSLSRAMGETAPLILVGALTYVAYAPGELTTPMDGIRDPQKVLNAPLDKFTSIPIQVFNWVMQPDPDFEHVAAAGCLVLLVVLVMFNATAIVIRNRAQRKISW